MNIQRMLACVVAVLAMTVAQQDSVARLKGIVSASRTGQPLSDVMVAVRGTARFHVTDSTGKFDIPNVPAGRHTLRLVYGNRVSEDYQLVLPAGRTVDLAILLDVGAGAVDLAPVVVEAASTEYTLSLAGFYARRGKGFGTFVTGDDIAQRRPHNLSTLLAGKGIVMRCQRSACFPTRVASGRRCAVSVFMDGMKVEQYDIDAIPPEDVMGIEIYRQGADTPVEFSRWSADCGAIVIWTKN